MSLMLLYFLWKKLRTNVALSPRNEYVSNLRIYSNSKRRLFMQNIFHSTVRQIIIWQDSLGVNPSVLIGSFLVGILPYGPFPWKRSYAVYFLSGESWQSQTTKRKRLNTLIFERNYLKRLIFYRAYNKNKEHKYSRSEFYYPEDLIQRLTQASANVKTIL